MTTDRPAATRRRLPAYGLVAAYFVSVAGTAMSALAIPWLVLTTTGSASRTGLVVFAEMAPYVVLQVVSGPWVDRLGAHRTCVWGNGIAAVAIGAIPALQAVDMLGLGTLMAVVAAAGPSAAWPTARTPRWFRVWPRWPPYRWSARPG